ncbi:MAG TPA: FAD-dependent tricarballylate dehydrogenase TcuA [Candidatus Polarisedimenticolaceae bacterium]|nr:FAD-dependent tricarballylate dehydrogenase TcuA [Candidatus Polarisedimenticolaceae bacterium]
MADSGELFDVLVVGGGNAGMCAAIMARRGGARVFVLESASKDFRGGNSRHTRDIRYMHKAATEYVTGPYEEDEFWEDLRQVTGGETNEKLARLTIRGSEELGDWMPANGVRWQKPLRGTLHLTRSNLFMLGGGKAMINAYYDTASRLGVEIAYESEVGELTIRDGEFRSAIVFRNGAVQEIPARAIVIAAGGFEANISWLKEYWGDAADNFIIRGTRHNQGRMLKELLRHGAKAVGNPRGCHAVALDARAPKFDGGIVTRLDSPPFGVVVNKDVKRFYDEGEDFWPKRYAIWGGLIANQPDQIAYSIIDAKALPHFMPSVFPPIEARSVVELAVALDLDPARLASTVDDFNKAVRPGTFDPGNLDDCHTEGIAPPKSHWARRIDTPPYFGYPLRPGITFTYLGVTVNEQARVIMQDERPAKNIFAAGEMMAGNILGKGYLAGFGLTIGSVFGRIAGREAARHVGT